MKEPRIYGSRWNKARLTFLRDNPLCVMCQEQRRVTAATVVDHKVPHKLKAAMKSGDSLAVKKAQKLFWDKGNWQALCDTHHSATKQRMEKSGVVIGCDASGYPLDPNLHWSK